MIRTGLIGRQIGASRSPWLHEQEARAQGLALSYGLVDFTDLDLPDAALGETLRALADDGFSGVNVTYPFKQAVIPLLDGLDESAETVGAVNTVAFNNGTMIGHNTDMTGFQTSLREDLPGADLSHVLQLGAGGAGAAVACALLQSGVGHLEITDIDIRRAKDLAVRLTARFGTGKISACEPAAAEPARAAGIVNTTPIGMSANPGLPIDARALEPRHWVYDIIYFPLETELLRVAGQRGCRTLNGSGMVVAQAAGGFEIFTGRRADSVRMRDGFISLTV